MDEVKIYRMADNKNDLPIYIRKYDLQEGAPVMHMHDSIQINYVLRGSLRHTINKTTYDLVKGDIFIIPPFVPHGLADKDNCDCEIIELEFLPEFIFGRHRTMEKIEGVFDFAYIEPFLVSECEVKPRLNLSGKAQVKVEDMLNSLFEEYSERRESFLLAMKATVLQLLVYVSRAFSKNIAQDESQHLYERHRTAITGAISYIDENFREDITIEKVSRIAMLSQSYFSYLFKSMTNRTFVEYLNELRLREAMRLLNETGKRVVDICFECGFNNVNHFNRTFKNYAGISPMQYRRGNKNN